MPNEDQPPEKSKKEVYLDIVKDILGLERGLLLTILDLLKNPNLVVQSYFKKKRNTLHHFHSLLTTFISLCSHTYFPYIYLLIVFSGRKAGSSQANQKIYTHFFSLHHDHCRHRGSYHRFHLTIIDTGNKYKTCTMKI